MQKSIITISGLPGSGKSSTAKRVAETLGFRHFSSGDLFRAIAKERNASIEEINHTAELEQEIDHMVDAKLHALSAEEHLVIDSRLAFHWIPESFKVFLTLEPAVAAQRIHSQITNEGRASEVSTSVEDSLKSVLLRIESERKRYSALYGVDYTAPSNFDLVIDTSNHPLPAVVAMIVDAYTKRVTQ